MRYPERSRCSTLSSGPIAWPFPAGLAATGLGPIRGAARPPSRRAAAKPNSRYKVLAGYTSVRDLANNQNHKTIAT
jgi:hypothetical protein